MSAFPPVGSRARVLVDYLLGFEPRRAKTFMSMAKDLAAEMDSAELQKTLSAERLVGHIVTRGRGYTLSIPYRSALRGAKIVQPAVAVPFKPLSTKYFIRAEANRPDAVQPSNKGFLISGTSEEKRIRGI